MNENPISLADRLFGTVFTKEEVKKREEALQQKVIAETISQIYFGDRGQPLANFMTVRFDDICELEGTRNVEELLRSKSVTEVSMILKSLSKLKSFEAGLIGWSIETGFDTVAYTSAGDFTFTQGVFKQGDEVKITAPGLRVKDQVIIKPTIAHPVANQQNT